MLYIVKPFGELTWTANVDQTLLDLARAHGKDPGTIAEWWQTASRSATDDDVRVALRYGFPTTDGIIVDARHVVPMHRPAGLRALAAENAVRTAKYNELPQVKMVEDYLETMSPGWREGSRKTDAGVAESLRNSIAEAVEEAAEELAQPVKPELVAHWQTLPGGYLPEPH